MKHPTIHLRDGKWIQYCANYFETFRQLGDKEAIKIYVDATARDTSMVTKALSETDIIPWEKTFTFTHIHSDYSTIIQGVLASHKANSFDVSPNNMFWFPSGKTIRMSWVHRMVNQLIFSSILAIIWWLPDLLSLCRYYYYGHNNKKQTL